jgi:O-antigen ligase
MATRERTLPGEIVRVPEASPPAEPERRSDAFIIYGGIMLLMVVASLDVLNFFDRPNGFSRYLILLLPIGAAFLVRARKPSLLIRWPTAGHAIVAAMFLIGLGGSLYGLAFKQTTQSTIGLFIALGMGLILLLATDGPTDQEVERTIHLLGLVGVVYMFMNFLVNSGVLPDDLKYRNASAAFVALAFACAIVERRWRRVAALVALYAVIFIGYPSATQVLIAIGFALTWWLTSWRATVLRTIAVLTTVIVLGAAALLNLNAMINITTSYFSDVHKVNANNGRLNLWTDGIEQFKESPFVGQLFTADAVALRFRDNAVLPFHNDIVLFLAEGGILGVGLLLAFIVYTELTLLERHREFLRAGDKARADLIRIILVMLNAFFIAMPFNPVMEGITRTATMFGVWAIAMSLGGPHLPAEASERLPAVEPMKATART